jgi:hypothetical protein
MGVGVAQERMRTALAEIIRAGMVVVMVGNLNVLPYERV